jgi:hypothetical protein
VPSHTATYLNNRNTQWQYDADGRLVQEQIRKFFFDAAGRQTQTGSINTTLTNSEIYDGNGFRVKRPSGYTTFELRSKVLGNQVVAQLGPQGTKTYGYIYADGKRVAKTSHELSNNHVFWEHKSPTNGALFLGSYGSVVSRDKEFDPYMDNVETENPYTGGGGEGGGGGYPSYGNPADFTGGCAWDGTAVSCGSFQKVFSRNRVEVLSWIVNTRIGMTTQQVGHIERFNSGSSSGGDSGSYNSDGSVGYAMNVVGTSSTFESAVTGSVMLWLNLTTQQSPTIPPETAKKYVDAFNKAQEDLKKRLEDEKCAALFGGKDKALAAINGTTYRFLDLGAPKVDRDSGAVRVVGAQTNSATSVFINTQGPFLNQSMFVQGAGLKTLNNGTGLRGASFGALLLLHELAHQLNIFGPDANNQELNEKYTKQVLDKCFR